MKKTLSFILIIIAIAFTYLYREKIYEIYINYFVSSKDKITKLEKNKYYRDYNFSYVKNTNNFIPSNKDDLKNIYYTVVNSGMNKFTFYCPKEYENCINDVNDLANDQDTISDINNFVHPYNSFKTLETNVESTGKISLNITRVYDDEMIIIINYKIDEIMKNEITNNDSLKEKIKKIHDYIINHTTYDKERSDQKIIQYKSDNAYGVLLEGYGLCGGYTDAMMLFLENFGVESIKISTENHIWNYVQLDNKWYHLDLTWDDPVVEDGKDILDHSYFLIDDTKLKSMEQQEHNYEREIYAQ